MDQIEELFNTGRDQAVKWFEEVHECFKEREKKLLESERKLGEDQKTLADDQKTLAEGQKALAEGQKALAEGQKALADIERKMRKYFTTKKEDFEAKNNEVLEKIQENEHKANKLKLAEHQLRANQKAMDRERKELDMTREAVEKQKAELEALKDNIKRRVDLPNSSFMFPSTSHNTTGTGFVTSTPNQKKKRPRIQSPLEKREDDDVSFIFNAWKKSNEKHVPRSLFGANLEETFNMSHMSIEEDPIDNGSEDNLSIITGDGEDIVFSSEEIDNSEPATEECYTEDPNHSTYDGLSSKINRKSVYNQRNKTKKRKRTPQEVRNSAEFNRNVILPLISSKSALTSKIKPPLNARPLLLKNQNSKGQHVNKAHDMKPTQSLDLMGDIWYWHKAPPRAGSSKLHAREMGEGVASIKPDKDHVYNDLAVEQKESKEDRTYGTKKCDPEQVRVWISRKETTMDILNILAGYPGSKDKNTGIERAFVGLALLSNYCTNDTKDEGNYSKLGDNLEPRAAYFAPPDRLTSREDKIMDMVRIAGIKTEERVQLATAKFILEMAGVEVTVNPDDWKLRQIPSKQIVDPKEFTKYLTLKEKQSVDSLLEHWMVTEECPTTEAVVKKIKGKIASIYGIAHQFAYVPQIEVRHTANMFKLSDPLCSTLYYFPKDEENGKRVYHT